MINHATRLNYSFEIDFDRYSTKQLDRFTSEEIELAAAPLLQSGKLKNFTAQDRAPIG